MAGALLLLASARPVEALNIQHFRPNTEGLGYLRLDGAVTLPRNSFSRGVAQNGMGNALEFGRTASGSRLDGVSKFYWGWDLWGAFGLWDSFEVGIDVPFSLLTSIERLDATSADTTVSMGDIELRGKWRLLSPEMNSADLGLALVPFITLPSGTGGDFYGDSSVTGGFRTVLERKFGKNHFTTNVGFRGRKKETLTASGFMFGAGWKRPISSGKQWWVLSEINGATDFADNAATPVEWDVAVQKRFWEQTVAVTLGGGMGLTTGYGSPDYRIQLALRYVPVLPGASKEKAKTEKDESAAKVEEGRIVILKPIPFEVNRAVLKPEASPVLDAVAELLKKQEKIRHVRIEGHTDSDGSEKFNLKLSQERATAVKTYLMQKGIETSRLETQGWGEMQPVVPNTTSDFKAQNRRVEFHVVKVEE